MKPYNDKQFPPNNSSLGSISGDLANINRNKSSLVKNWIRAPLLPCFKDKKVQLFQDKVEPNDIKQGEIGDCWLMAAIACVAEEPNRIQRLFKDFEIQQDGKYKIKLYDPRENIKKWVHIIIDDYIPVKGRPG